MGLNTFDILHGLQVVLPMMQKQHLQGLFNREVMIHWWIEYLRGKFVDGEGLDKVCQLFFLK